MKITYAEIILTKIPTRRPHRMSFATTQNQEAVFVKLFTDEGVTGWGEAPHMAGYSGAGETQGSVALQLRERLIPAILGKDPMQIEARQIDMDRVVPWNPRAKSAVNMALYDLVGKYLNTPVYNLLGGMVRDRVPLSWSLPITDNKAAVEEANAMAERGWRILKMKVGHEDPQQDISRTHAVRQAVGAEVNIRADANQAWDVPTAIRAIRELEKDNLQFMEQPTKIWDLDGAAEIRQATNTYIMADESANSPLDVLNLAKKRAADLISIYINNPGGITNAKKMAIVAEPAGIGCYIGGALEGPIGARACLHLAASCPNVTWGCEMTGQFLMEADIGTEPIGFEGGALIVPQTPGLGGDLDPDKLAKYKIGGFEVRPA
ncbi:MAG TPA: enolase C-terminal domain-like protein [Phototrophicaceae bacterium]|nr:enolase C-terminal domain-like protein [Phototrophicaceae bacterium]